MFSGIEMATKATRVSLTSCCPGPFLRFLQAFDPIHISVKRANPRSSFLARISHQALNHDYS